MDKKTYRTYALAMLELVICSLNNEKPKKSFLKHLNLDELFTVCQEHILTACAAYALESAGIKDRQFTQAKEKALRKNILLDVERNRIFSRFEKEKIRYMPLKGSVIKNWYPKLGMRQMSDNDILYDAKYREKVREIMLDSGFSCEHFGRGNDDAYFKPPVCNFEMHNELFNELNNEKFNRYYLDIEKMLIKDEDNGYGYHFSNEDFYIYITAHEHKHFVSGGTGVRCLADRYIILKKYGKSLNWEYILKELKKLGIADYEHQSRKLALKIFKRQELTEKEQKLLNYHIFSGTYGNIENKVKNGIKNYGKGSKTKYILRRIFPPMQQIKVRDNFFYRHKWLIPVLLVYRPFRGLFTKRKKIMNELKYIFRT